MRTQQVTFHLQKKAVEFSAAVAFARKQAFQWYRCEPSDIPERIFAARVGAQVVATVGVTDSFPRQLPIQQLYDLEKAQLPCDWHWESVVQLSWFFSNMKGCFMTLLLKALNYCHLSSKRYAVLQMKEVVSSMLKEKGLQLMPIFCSQLRLDKVSEADRGYYQDTSPVRLYYLDIIKNIFSIRNYILRNQSQAISLQYNDACYELHSEIGL
ncbi:hypothetical protein EP47_04085 [Legionella norrlandica]|uniref:Uncharacterized protein n=1 Tax=Legionella norrlandica TaxID=1498499 RepID=A0A0A2SSX9_9GAMM|nr:hypothetical protein [Legionella norrlandica]KGP64240.1 hypothetical protein EP47_04085 [Legionella norrlandica]